MIYRVLICIIVCSLTPSVYTQAKETNAGFVQGIWYATDPIFAEEPTRIYVALRNNTPHDLVATVRFTDNQTRIGSSEIRVLSGRLIEAWTDWIPTKGPHTIQASVSDAVLHIIGGGTQSIDAITSMVAEDSLAIDIDTDKDFIGNDVDTDDDNDGVSDKEERSRGSNPLEASPTQEVSSNIQSIQENQISNEQTPHTVDKNSGEGLEKYFDDGTIDAILSGTTEKITSLQKSITTYQDRRHVALQEKDQNIKKENDSLQSASDDVTITRLQSKPEQSILESLTSKVSLLLRYIWTFILWLSSVILAYPAIVEIFLLIGILYVLYKTARRFGKRTYS